MKKLFKKHWQTLAFVIFFSLIGGLAAVAYPLGSDSKPMAMIAPRGTNLAQAGFVLHDIDQRGWPVRWTFVSSLKDNKEKVINQDQVRDTYIMWFNFFCGTAIGAFLAWFMLRLAWSLS